MIAVRIANEHDSLDIFEWRNDAVTREMSLSENAINWDEHNKWFIAALQNSNRLLVMCELDGQGTKVAVVRFDIKNERALISINLAPSQRGKGFAKACLQGAISYLTQVYTHVHFIDADIKSVNKASQVAFEGIGFAKTKESEDLLRYEYLV